MGSCSSSAPEEEPAAVRDYEGSPAHMTDWLDAMAGWLAGWLAVDEGSQKRYIALLQYIVLIADGRGLARRTKPSTRASKEEEGSRRP